MPPTDTTPLLPQPSREQAPASQGDSHTWTGVHTFQPNGAEPDDDSGGSSAKARIARFFTPPHRPSTIKRVGFSMFYTVSHIFTLLNTALYWTVLVPAGHGGFKAPEIPSHRHGPSNATGIFYDPDKGLFEEDDIKAFSILNVWTITAVIAFVEVVFFNSIRRHSPVVGHVVGTMVASGLYLAWASIGKLATDHWGLFFLDPKLMGNSTGTAVAAGVGFVVAAPIILTYLHGLTAMREAITASH
ncbi:hypothetical protein EKO27_g11932 [Xylaria grammica]|uniref:Uncharacterized protein n=1 Tax=Xylaria grammica TaxID=363999 RepID=A0A439CLY5_9PEZI|nr:hypothetical protein EKO27_g11932 [Xylaria grammica]